MHLSFSASALLVLSLTGQTMAERSWFCPLSLDASMIQTPYCCEGFVLAKDSEVSMEGVSCIDVSKDFTKSCPLDGTPKCCYSIGKAVICTTEVEDGVDE
ncbi:uncharacterized protein BDV17DRAFT_9207 [Aspergillus undulatus]|uniref:uncharacterized protein n=1 Tax=Aspergillus undulatus TaxID=1810928 RepID=UPI003CCD263F